MPIVHTWAYSASASPDPSRPSYGEHHFQRVPISIYWDVGYQQGTLGVYQYWTCRAGWAFAVRSAAHTAIRGLIRRWTGEITRRVRTRS